MRSVGGRARLKLRYDPPAPEQALAWWNTVVLVLDCYDDDELLRSVLLHRWPNAEQIERLMGVSLGETVGSAKLALRPLLPKIARRARRAPHDLPWPRELRRIGAVQEWPRSAPPPPPPREPAP